MKFLFSSALLVAAFAGIYGGSGWSYADPSKWGDHCDGSSQSPVDVRSHDVVADDTLVHNKLAFARYGRQLRGTFKNNGHTLQFDIDPSVRRELRPRIGGGGLGEDVYIFAQFHFHWGDCARDDCHGSEHTIDGRGAPAEIHFVHYNSKYESVGAALGHEDGLAVIGFKFEAVTDSSKVTTHYSDLTGVLNKVVRQHATDHLIPSGAFDGTSRYFRYSGSLTTPPCSEVVTWTLFQDRIPMLESTFDMFLDATQEDHDQGHVAIANNYRPVQPLNGRVVKTNIAFDDGEQEVDAFHWSYSDPSKWGGQCNGHSQSPIDIRVGLANADVKLATDRLVFDRYVGQLNGTVVNNGHTLQFDIDPAIPAERRPRIHGGGLGNGGYIFAQFHFHWGDCAKDDCHGSEHTFDGVGAPAEIHFVHYNSKYDSVGAALGHEDGLAVIGFKFEAVTNPARVTTRYSDLTDVLGRVRRQNVRVVTLMDLEHFVPKAALYGKEPFFRYSGSLTTPPCSEVVTWTLFQNRIAILESTFNMFLDATKADGTHGHVAIANNYRPVQPLNGRNVKTNKVDSVVTQNFYENHFLLTGRSVAVTNKLNRYLAVLLLVLARF